MKQMLPMFRVALGAVFPGDEGMDVARDSLFDKMRLIYWDRSITRNTHGRELRLFFHQMGLNWFFYHLSTPINVPTSVKIFFSPASHLVL